MTLTRVEIEGNPHPPVLRDQDTLTIHPEDGWVKIRCTGPVVVLTAAAAAEKHIPITPPPGLS